MAEVQIVAEKQRLAKKSSTKSVTLSEAKGAAGEDPYAAKIKQILRWKREKDLALKKKKSQDVLEARSKSEVRELKPEKLEVVGHDPGKEVKGRKSEGTLTRKVKAPQGESEVKVKALQSGPSTQDAAKGPQPATPKSASRKKVKGMQLDAVYREYMGKFLNETAMLLLKIEHWTTATSGDAGKIPEKIVGDIGSLIGQAKLLLDSKLPQFAELLYFYLIRRADPHVLLPCDLEGWWDVAQISIDKVKDGFLSVDEALQQRSVKGKAVKTASKN